MFNSDKHTVLTLDAGGTNFVFSAIRGGEPAGQAVKMPSNGHELNLCLDTMIAGFEAVRDSIDTPISAISFAFPGPANYAQGVVEDLFNLPCFRGGVALTRMLEMHFGVPAFMNNDGNMFAYGEAIFGFLPWINNQLTKHGSPRRFANLVGVTLGTGFGGGVVLGDRLLMGDNSLGGEIWCSSQRYSSISGIEEAISIRAIRREYAAFAGIPFADSPSPKDIFEIGTGCLSGDQAAALHAYRMLGRSLGDVLSNILTLIDGVAVIGGGLAGAAELFVPAMMDEMRSTYTKLLSGEQYNRLDQRVFNLMDSAELDTFCRGEQREIIVPRSSEHILYDPMTRLGVGITKNETSRSIALGAYAYALSQLQQKLG